MIPHSLGFRSREMGATLQRHVALIVLWVVEVAVILGLGSGFCGR